MSESHDPWEAARGSQREEVAAIWAGRGTPPPRPPRSRDWRRIARVAIPLLVVVAVVALVLIPSLRSEGDRDRKVADARQAELIKAEVARLTHEGRPFRAQGPQARQGEAVAAYRGRLRAAGEADILRNARERIAAGELHGEANGAECRTYPFTDTRTAQETDPDVARNRYQCVVYSREFGVGELNGQQRSAVIGLPYWLVADYATGKLTFCKITPKAGEGGRLLATVPVDPACLDPLA